MKRFSNPFRGWLAMLLLATGTASAQAPANTFAASANHTASIQPDGTLWTWGLNLDGQLGNGDTFSRILPTQVTAAGTLRWAQVATGTSHTLALTADGELYSWGNNTDGQLGSGPARRQLTPVRIALPAEAASTHWTQVAAGTSHSLALTADGRLYAWGDNAFGQVGDGTTLDRAALVRIALPAGTISQIAAGSAHSLALMADGQLYAWGSNKHGQLGDGTTTQRQHPVAVAQLGKKPGAWAQVAAGRAHTLALSADGQLYAWGSNEYGQLADANHSLRTRPTAVALPQAAQGSTWAQVAAGASHSQALTTDGRLYAWGSNLAGQLGDGSTLPRTEPVAVALPAEMLNSGWAQIAAGSYHTLAVSADGQLCTWGENTHGQLGDGSMAQRSFPARSSRALLQPSSRDSHSSQLPGASTQADRDLDALNLIVAEASLPPLSFNPTQAWLASSRTDHVLDALNLILAEASLQPLTLDPAQAWLSSGKQVASH